MIKNLSKICIKNLSRSYKRSDSRQGDPGPLGDEGGRRLISVAVKMLRLVKIIQRILMIGRSPPWFLLAGFSCCFCFLCHFLCFLLLYRPCPILINQFPNWCAGHGSLSSLVSLGRLSSVSHQPDDRANLEIQVSFLSFSLSLKILQCLHDKLPDNQ